MPDDDHAEWKPSAGMKIERLYCWIATQADGGEGLCAAMIGDVFMPLVAADKARMESLREHAKQIGQLTDSKVALVEFSTRTVLES